MNKPPIFTELINKEKKNILFLIASIGGGGAERVGTLLVSEFSKKHNVYLMYFNFKDKTYPISPNVHLIPFFVTNEIKKEFYPKVKDSNLIRILEIEKVRRRYNIDITISFLFSPNTFNIKAEGGGIKILSERNDPTAKGESYFKEMSLAYEKADKVVFQTNYVKNKFSTEIKMKGIIIPNPICVSCLADKIPKKKIVAVGRLIEQKNHELLIKSFAIFHKIHKEYYLNIYGAGPLLEQLKLLVYDLSIQNYVNFKGFCDDVQEKIKDAEIFVLSSNFEGMPNALMEAMMMGLPCISTNCSSLPEIIDNEKNGILVEKDDVSGLARAMLRLSEDEILREKIRRNAMRKSEEWRLDKIVSKWEELFY